MSLFGNYIEDAFKKSIGEIIVDNVFWFENETLNEDLIVKNNLPGHIDGGNIVKIEVYTNEGENIPHFHIENDKFSCCVEIFKCAYFVHSWHTDTLNNSQAKRINKIMKSKYTNIGNVPISVWQKCVMVWNRYPKDLGYNPNATDEENLINMSKYQLPDASQQPDYSKLNG